MHTCTNCNGKLFLSNSSLQWGNQGRVLMCWTTASACETARCKANHENTASAIHTSMQLSYDERLLLLLHIPTTEHYARDTRLLDKSSVLTDRMCLLSRKCCTADCIAKVKRTQPNCDTSYLAVRCAGCLIGMFLDGARLVERSSM